MKYWTLLGLLLLLGVVAGCASTGGSAQGVKNVTVGGETHVRANAYNH